MAKQRDRKTKIMKTNSFYYTFTEITKKNEQNERK